MTLIGGVGMVVVLLSAAPLDAVSEPEIQRPTKPAELPAEPVPEPSDVSPPEPVPPEPVPPEPVPPEPVPPEPVPPSVPTPAPPQPAEPSFDRPLQPEATVAPAPLPATSDTVVASEPKPTLQLPYRTGRRLMIGSLAAGVVGWSMSLGSIGTVRNCDDGLDGCVGRFVWMTGFRWVANGAALGLAIPAGVYRGRYDAVEEAIDGTPPRNTKAFVAAGAAAVAIGTVGWFTLRGGFFSFLGGCEGGDGEACLTGYLAGLQTSFALASAGSGLLAYGLAHRHQKWKLDTDVEVRFVPQLSPQYSGLSLAGRF